MEKVKKMKKFLCGLLAMVMVITCFQVKPVYAQTHYTKAKLTKMISTAKKEVTDAKKKWNAEKKKYKSQTKGTTAIFGKIISSNPCIIYSYSFTGNSYYWVEDSKNIDSLISAGGGYLKLTGKYKNYNGITCAVGRAVKVTANPEKYKRIYEEKTKKLQALKNAIKNYAEFNEKQKTVYLGKKTTIYYWWKYDGYSTGKNLSDMKYYNNKENFKVSYDKSMVKLKYDNYAIYVTPLKEGKTNVTISNELVKKKSTITLNITKTPIKNDTEDNDGDSDDNITDNGSDNNTESGFVDDDSDYEDDSIYDDDNGYDDNSSYVDNSDFSKDYNNSEDDY